MHISECGAGSAQITASEDVMCRKCQISFRNMAKDRCEVHGKMNILHKKIWKEEKWDDLLNYFWCLHVAALGCGE